MAKIQDHGSNAAILKAARANAALRPVNVTSERRRGFDPALASLLRSAGSGADWLADALEDSIKVTARPRSGF